MTDVRNLLISGSEKVIGHYRMLLANARSESERELYRARIARAAPARHLAGRLPGSIGGVNGHRCLQEDAGDAPGPQALSGARASTGRSSL